MNNEVAITTVDNPYNPFTQWNDWYLYDRLQGYNTCERLASITLLSDQLSDYEKRVILEESIDELIKYGAISKSGEIIEYKKLFK